MILVFVSVWCRWAVCGEESFQDREAVWLSQRNSVWLQHPQMSVDHCWPNTGNKVFRSSTCLCVVLFVCFLVLILKSVHTAELAETGFVFWVKSWVWCQEIQTSAAARAPICRRISEDQTSLMEQIPIELNALQPGSKNIIYFFPICDYISMTTVRGGDHYYYY